MAHSIVWSPPGTKSLGLCHRSKLKLRTLAFKGLPNLLLRLHHILFNPSFRAVLQGASLRQITRKLAQHRGPRCQTSAGKHLRRVPSLHCVPISLTVAVMKHDD